MRSEKEMMDLILSVARKDERVRAVCINGSRTNPNVPKDRFQDYDVVYLVNDLPSFLQDKHWIDVFGPRIILQTPEAMSLMPPELGGRFTYLMLFQDGNRIDLMLTPLEHLDAYCKEDKLIVPLLDKDGILPSLAPPTDEDYHVKKPSGAFFADCCNEFWWVSTYVAKGLWRRELLYAQEHLNSCVRPMLLTILEWKVGIETGFSVSCGKCSKYLEQYVTPQEWQALCSTFASGDYADCWNALFAMTDLFRNTSRFVSQHLGYPYPEAEDQNVSKYLQEVYATCQ